MEYWVTRVHSTNNAPVQSNRKPFLTSWESGSRQCPRRFSGCQTPVSRTCSQDSTSPWSGHRWTWPNINITNQAWLDEIKLHRPGERNPVPPRCCYHSLGDPNRGTYICASMAGKEIPYLQGAVTIPCVIQTGAPTLICASMAGNVIS